MEMLKNVLAWLLALLAATAVVAGGVLYLPPLITSAAGLVAPAAGPFVVDPFTVWLVAGVVEAAVILVLAVYAGPVVFTGKFVFKSLRRNLLRTSLTAVATMVLVFVITLVWSVLYFLHLVMTEKSKDLKAIVTERWNIPSQMPWQYHTELEQGAPDASKSGELRVKPEDSMTWQFYGGTLDGSKMTRENFVFFFAMDPDRMLTMMDGIDEFTAAQQEQLRQACKMMKEDRRKVIIGKERLKALNKRVGERVTVTSITHKGIDLEVEIAGELPEGRYGQNSVMNCEYLNKSLDDYDAKHPGAEPLSKHSLNLVWLRVPDKKDFEKASTQIETSPLFADRPVKCETASSGIASFLDAYKDLLWGMEYLLSPAVLATMAVVIATAISISVRERRTEMAVLKVLGFGPNRVLMLVLAEAVVLGAGSGLLSALLTYAYGNWLGAFKFQIAFFPTFRVPDEALVWGPFWGGACALLGALLPAWSARSVKVVEVFSKVA
jgi:putative ABC transport system permease protein